MSMTDLMDAASARDMSDFSSNCIFTERYNNLMSKAVIAIRNASKHGLHATNIFHVVNSAMKQRIKKELTDLGYNVEFFPMLEFNDLIERPEFENISIIISWSNTDER